MNSVADFVSPEQVETMATPANLRLGREIDRKGGVTFSIFGPLEVVARVTNGVARSVTLRSDGRALTWRCTCSGNRKLFCKHCVAVATAAWNKAP